MTDVCEETPAMDEDQVNSVIQRWRDTPEEDLKPEDYEQFRSLGSACLAENGAARILRFIEDEKNQQLMVSMGHTLVAPLVNEVVKKEKCPDHCQAALTHLTTICRPDELLHSLLQIIQDVHPTVISETIITVVPLFQTVLLELEERRAASVGLVLSALLDQLVRLPVPHTEQQEVDDEFGLCHCCEVLAQFVKCLTEEVKRKDDDDEEMRTELLQFCLRTLRELLLEAELKQDRKVSPLWLFATEIMATLVVVKASASELLFYGSLRKSQCRESRACLAYLLFVQLITADSFPAVFSPVFVLQCNMEYISQLLSSKKESHLLKGLALFAKSLENVQDNRLPVSLLELPTFYSAPQNLRQILTDCPMQHLRKSGLHVFQLFIDKLDVEAKHKFFRCMLKTSSHAGVEGYIVKNIRNQVEFSMEPANGNKWFLGEEFLSLLALVLCVPQAAETDLLNSMDRIMESLNLLRYLLIRDKEPWSKTGVWAELCRIKDEYLKTLRVCIGLSRGYYSAELNALREDQKLKAREARDAARCGTLVSRMTVKHEKVSNMSPEAQRQVLQSALVTFDLMESLIFRIDEITAENLKIQT
ncbi:glomulin-like [Solea solea]|uniref:glomulin-like n=1 Tax=Solea solea TaxID=90069 RepID=UPI00272B5B19|nr:glomulin-like [Solea solea]